MKKKFKIPNSNKTHPKYEEKLLAARTFDFKHHRRDGMIRSSSWSIARSSSRDRYKLIEDWEADRDKEGGNTISSDGSCVVCRARSRL